MKSLLPIIAVSLFAIVIVAFFVQPYILGDVTSSRLTFVWNWLLLPDEILGGWLSIPDDWKATANAQAYWNSLNTSILPMNRWSVLFVTLIESFWIYSLGRLILKAFRFTSESLLFRFCLTCLLGTATLSALTGILGLLGLLQTGLFWTMAIISMIGGSNLFSRSGNFPEANASGSPSTRLLSQSILSWIGIGTIVVFCLFAILPAMTPPWEFDVREYHLESVKEFYLNGRITALPYNAYANMPIGAESLVLVSMILSGDWFLGALAGKTVLSLSVPLTAMLLFCLGERFSSKKGGLIAALIYVTSPLIIHNAQFGLIDNVLAMFALGEMGVISCEIRSEKREARSEKFLVLSAECLVPRRDSSFLSTKYSALSTFLALLVAMTVSIKYPGVLFVALPVLVTIIYLMIASRYTIREMIRTTAVFIGTTMLFGGVWYLKNAILLGNPVYPLASGLFGAEFPVGFSAESYTRWQTVHAPHWTNITLLLQPVIQFFFMSNDSNPLLLPIIVCSLIFWTRIPKIARWSLIYSGFYLVGWLTLTHGIERFLLPVIPFIALAGGMAIEQLLILSNVWTGRIVKGLFAVAIVYSGIIVALPLPGGMLGAFENISVLRSMSLRLGDGLTWLVENKSQELINMQKSGEHIALIGDAAVFDFPVPIEYTVCFNSDAYLESLSKLLNTSIQNNSTKSIPTAIVVNLNEIARYEKTEYGYSTRVKSVLNQLEHSSDFTPVYRSSGTIIYWGNP